MYFNREKRTFSKKAAGGDRTFVEFILEPLYKLIAQTVGDLDTTLADTLSNLDIFISKTELKDNIPSLLRNVCRKFFGLATGFVEMITEHIPSPAANGLNKANTLYTGDRKSPVVEDMIQCNPE